MKSLILKFENLSKTQTFKYLETKVFFLVIKNIYCTLWVLKSQKSSFLVKVIFKYFGNIW